MNTANAAEVVAHKIYLEMCQQFAVSAKTVESMADHVAELVDSGLTTWDELEKKLGFTSFDLSDCLLDAYVRDAQEDYAKMNSRGYSYNSVAFLAGRIRNLVDNGFAEWDDLGFTADDVAKRLNRKAA